MTAPLVSWSIPPQSTDTSRCTPKRTRRVARGATHPVVPAKAVESVSVPDRTSFSEGWCGRCGTDVRDSCWGALRRRGVMKVHWECWSTCNLPCAFCFRTRGEPVGARDASRIIAAVATGGAHTMVFAGGDPSLRSDLEVLVNFAKTCNLRVEVQTNAHLVRDTTWKALLRTDRVCLSLDGPTPDVHDGQRSTAGNFERVLTLARRLEAEGIPITVRTVVTLMNYQWVPQIGEIVATFGNCEVWSLLEFTPVGDGFVNRMDYELGHAAFVEVASETRRTFTGSATIDIFQHEDKVGTYFQIAPTGEVYGVTRLALYETGHHEMSGTILRDHLDVVAGAVYLTAERQARRYGHEVPVILRGARQNPSGGAL